MLIQISQQISDKDLIRKRCKLDAQNDLEYADMYGWNTEFIGTLQVQEKDNKKSIYNFKLEKVMRDRKIGSVFEMNANKASDLSLMILALENDYGIKDFVLQ